MLGSIEKGRKLPQFGRRHNVTFFNKVYPLAWLVLMQPNWAFHCILSLRPASQKKQLTLWTWGYKEPMCPHSGFHIPQRVWGESCFVIFSSPVINGLWQAPRRSEQKLLELVGARSANAHGGGGRGRKAILSEGAQWLSPGSGREKPLFMGQANIPDWNGKELQRGGGLGQYNNRSQEPLDASASGFGLLWFPGHSSQSSGQFLQWENILLCMLPRIFPKIPNESYI